MAKEFGESTLFPKEGTEGASKKSKLMRGGRKTAASTIKQTSRVKSPKEKADLAV